MKSTRRDFVRYAGLAALGWPLATAASKASGRVVVVGIAGNPAPVQVTSSTADGPLLVGSCDSDAGIAYPAVRLTEFLAGFGGHGIFGSVCSDNLAPVLEAAAPIIASQL